MKIGLRAQILGALLLVTVGGIVSVGVLSVWRIRQVLVVERQERAAALATLAGEMVSRLTEGAASDDERRARLDARAAELRRAIGASEIAVPALGWPRGARALDRDGPGTASAAPAMTPVPYTVDGGRLVLYAPWMDGGRKLGAVRTIFDADASVDATLASAQRRVIWLAVLNALVLIGAAAWMLRSAVVRPVLDLERAAGRVAGGDLTARVEMRGPGEIGRLADAFDTMTRSLRENRESLIRSEKLAGVGRLAAGVAHEVGNPLAAILGYVETLLSATPEKPIDPRLEREILERVRAETERIHRIIQELLDYSRPPRDDVGPVVVRPAIDAAISLIRNQARARGVTVEVTVPDDLPPVRASAGRLTQVLLNLLLNAVDAMDGEGTLRVSARREDARVIVAVDDEGPGVPPDLRGKVFDPFFTTKDPGKGTGLGLSVSLAIVEGLGGAMRVVDAPGGKGARFEVALLAAASSP